MPFKIFYLDDEYALLDIFKDIFTNPNVEVITFQNYSELLKTLNNEKPDLLFLDNFMPNTSGPEIAKKIDPDIPKILLTGDLDYVKDDVFVASFEKPLNIDKIENLIQQFALKKYS